MRSDLGRWMAVLGLAIGLIGGGPAVPAQAQALPAFGPIAFQAPVTREEADDAAAITRVFAARSYDLRAVRRTAEAPRLYVLQVPPDLSQISTTSRKELFVALLLPNILKANETVLAQRQALRRLLAKPGEGLQLSAQEQDWLERLARAYRVTAADWTELQRRVDIVPPSLAIAQAIDESAWGTSHFARDGNALFGEHLPPHSKTKSIESVEGHVKLAAFDTIMAGVRAYLHHLNTGRTYRELREIRARARARAGEITGYDLSFGLQSYSARANSYVKELQVLMKQQQLADYDGASLGPGGAVLIEPAR